MLNNLQRMDGDHHKQQRRLMMPAFHGQHMMKYHHAMIDQTQHMLDRWEVGREFDLLRAMQQLTQNVMNKTLFGLDDDKKVAQLSDLIHKLTKVMMLGVRMPVDIPGFPYHQALRIAQKLDAEMRAIIEQKRARPEATDILAALIQTHDGDGEKLSNDQLIGQIFAFYTTAYQTPANALTWTNFLLAQHPHILADLLNELDEKLHGTPPTSEQLSQLPLLECVVKESLRLFPP
ncbi:MAG TPA: cytochrome P450, partial [Ktedonobacter sp.]|nr:cytochrome P450 [Ktedonobacter sp.]